MEAQVLEGQAGLAACESDWRHLQAGLRDAAYHLEYGVVRAALAWLETDPANQLIVRVSEGGECVALIRLAPRERRLFRVLKVRALEIAGYAECPHQDMLMKDGVDPERIWHCLSRALSERGVRWGAITAPAVPRGQGIDRLSAALRERSRVVAGTGVCASANRFDTRRPFADLASMFGPTLRKNLDKGWRRIARAGAWDVVSVRGAESTRWAYDEFCRVEASGWKGADGTASAAALEPRNFEYFRELFLLGTEAGGDARAAYGEVNLLRLDEHAIAAQLCVVSGGARFVIKIGFDEAHRRLGPGQLLMEEMLRRSCADASIRAMSLVSHQPWHLEWAPERLAVSDFMILRSKVLALAWRAFDALRSRRSQRGAAACVGGLASAALSTAALSTALLSMAPGSASAATELPAKASASTWRFEPARDEFGAGALLDLRSLNETVAGETGFVRVDSKGDFVRGDGKPIRFWAVNSDVGHGSFQPAPLGPKLAPDLARHARFLAKRGVNMVRLHRQLSPSPDASAKAAITDIDEAERDSIWRAVAAMRKEGIYTTLSPYWSARMKFAPGWGVAGGSGQQAFGLLFFDTQLQDAYKAWLRKLFAERNPYTGIALAKDPSVAIIQIQNEDSLLFWTVDGIQGAQREALERRYAAFLKEKYGSLAAAIQSWKNDRAEADAPDAGRLALLPMWELAQPAPSGAAGGLGAALRAGLDWVRPAVGGHEQRRADQTEFYARAMSDFNRKVVKFLREELGARQLINPGNWKTASSAQLNDAERWSYLPGEVDAVNVYTGGLHEGANGGWAILPGDKFTSKSVLLDAGALPINLRQTAGRPMLVTEGGWIMPNAYATEGPFLIAAYSSLTGVDGYYWFATNDEGWSPPQSANGYLPSQQKWMFGSPDVLGTFPAAALAYRRGDLRLGEPVLSERRTLADLWQRRPPVLEEAPSFDPNRDAVVPAPVGAKGGDAKGGDAKGGGANGTQRGALPREAFLLGPVHAAFDAASAAVRIGDLKGMAEPGIIRANTGQIVVNQTLGVCSVDSPRAQGVAAFFSHAPQHQLTDVRFTSRDAYGAAMAVSLDGLPLRESRNILVQYGTQSRPTGWQEAPTQIVRPDQPPIEGLEVKSFGGAPWQVMRAHLEVRLRNPGLTTATVLDMNGMAVGTIPLKRTGAQVEFAFPEAAMYVVLR